MLFFNSFDIIGSTFNRPPNSLPGDTPSTGNLSLLQDAEGNNCTSFPAELLQLVQAGAQISDASGTHVCQASEAVQRLLKTAQDFDPFAWALRLQSRSPAKDVMQRHSLAIAHCAAVCIYLSRILLALDPLALSSASFSSYVSTVVRHLCAFRPADDLFTATTWPAFVAGAETDDPIIQDWARRRFEEMWSVEPWGNVKGALGLLESIWKRRSLEAESIPHDWVSHLRSLGVNWLVI